MVDIDRVAVPVCPDADRCRPVLIPVPLTDHKEHCMFCGSKYLNFLKSYCMFNFTIPLVMLIGPIRGSDRDRFTNLVNSTTFPKIKRVRI